MSDPTWMPIDQWYASLPSFLASAAAVITNSAGEVLVVKPNYRDAWNLPGGVLEADEPPDAACAREVSEELGLSRPVGRLLAVGWTPPTQIRRAAFAFLFDGGVLEDLSGVRLQTEELDDCALLPPDEALHRLMPQVADRLRQALRVRDTGTVAYVVDRGLPEI